MKNLLAIVLTLWATMPSFAQNSVIQQDKIRIEGHITGLEHKNQYSLDV
jgi:hypothetical protein